MKLGHIVVKLGLVEITGYRFAQIVLFGEASNAELKRKWKTVNERCHVGTC